MGRWAVEIDIGSGGPMVLRFDNENDASEYVTQFSKLLQPWARQLVTVTCEAGEFSCDWCHNDLPDGEGKYMGTDRVCSPCYHGRAY